MTGRDQGLNDQEKLDLAQIKQQKSRLHAKPIGSVMRKLLSERDYAAVSSTQNMLDAWNSIVQSEHSQHARPCKATRGVLTVEVDNSLVLQEIHFDKPRILKALQVRVPEFKLTDIRFRTRASRS